MGKLKSSLAFVVKCANENRNATLSEQFQNLRGVNCVSNE